METNTISYYIGTFLGAALILIILALPVVLAVIAIRNYLTLRKEVQSYRTMVEAEDLEAARLRALDDAEEAKNAENSTLNTADTNTKKEEHADE